MTLHHHIINSDRHNVIKQHRNVISATGGTTLRSTASNTDFDEEAFLGFQLEQERYAMPIELIGEILRIPPVTVVPRAAPTIMGIVGVRGRVLTVVDLRGRLGLSSPAPTRQARILVLPWSDHDSVGLYVDSVIEVHRFSPKDIEPAAAGFGRDQVDHVGGIARVDDHLVLILRLDPFLELIAK